MKVIFLGTNGWYDTKTGNTTCILIETAREFIILDAGNGFYKIDKYIKSKKPIYLFLSHYHLDHICGLHTVNKLKLPQGLDVFGPLGLKKMFNTIMNKPYSIDWRKVPTEIRLHEIKNNGLLPLSLEFKKLKHSSLCYGYRFNLEDKIISYCTDTGFCHNLIALSENADLLLAECSFLPGETNKDWSHLNPELAAKAAKEAKAKKLGLIHFDANRYSSVKKRQLAKKEAVKIFKNVFLGRDSLEIQV